MKLFSTLLIATFFIFSSCNEIDAKGELPAKAFVQQWNDNHTPLRASFLKNHYMDVVVYYDLERTKEQVATDKKVLFEEFPDYQQAILLSGITVVKEAGNYLVTFDKNVIYNGKKETYPCFLSLIYKNGNFKILREGVDATAENLAAPIFPKNRLNNAQITKNPRVYGDFNGDGLSDFASVLSPVIISKDAQNRMSENAVLCKGGCTSTIRFSITENKSIEIEDAYASQLVNLRDLNGDGADELGFWNLKESSKSLYIFDVANNKLITPPLFINTAVHKNLKLIDVIKKSGREKITVTESVLENGKWVLISRIVEVQ